MTQDNNKSLAGRTHEPEQIDLIDLVVQIWRGKITVIICFIVAILLAIGYIILAQEKWTSTAIITQPDGGQITGYSNAMNVMYGKDAPSMNAVQQSFIDRFSSSFSALSETLDNQQEPEKLTLDSAVKGQNLPLKVTYTAPTAEAAQKTLAQYIQQVDEDVAKGLSSDLNVNIKARVTDLQTSLSNQEKVSAEQKALRIAQINQALTVAEQAQIKTPQVQQADQVSQDTMFMLGSSALEAMVKNEATRPLTFSDDYYATRQNLLAVSSLTVKPDELHAYRYVMKPTLPVRRDSPKRALVLILAVLLGGMVGAGIVLGRNALRNYQPKA
ncbi:LPS O-antigen chain length determinant protein WzzB [Enterobacteriaceae bacterium 89]|nr:LPS O-antigen chain length determinant protein WzzB [Enterobacteriaceae bacterium 89]